MHWDPNRRGSAAKILHHPYFEASNVELNANAAVSVEFSAVRTRPFRPCFVFLTRCFFLVVVLVFFAKMGQRRTFFLGEANSKMGRRGRGLVGRVEFVSFFFEESVEQSVEQ